MAHSNLPNGENRSSAAEVRDAQAMEIDHLARLWHDGWQDAHARVVPHELARHRTLESFRQRLGEQLAQTRVAGPTGSAAGLCMIKQDELHQLFVSKEARGTGIAAALLADAEQRLAAAGVTTSWLACAIGNDRAARFYEKSRWVRAGTMINKLSTSDGIFPLEVWRYEKRLRID